MITRAYLEVDLSYFRLIAKDIDSFDFMIYYLKIIFTLRNKRLYTFFYASHQQAHCKEY